MNQVLNNSKKEKKNPKQKVNINYNENIDYNAGLSSKFDYFEDEDPYKEIMPY